MSYSPSYPAQLNLASSDGSSTATFSFNDLSGVFDISTNKYTSAPTDYQTITINGKTLDIATNLQPYEAVISVPGGNYTGTISDTNPAHAPIAIATSLLGITTVTMNVATSFADTVSFSHGFSLQGTDASHANIICGDFSDIIVQDPNDTSKNAYLRNIVKWLESTFSLSAGVFDNT